MAAAADHTAAAPPGGSSSQRPPLVLYDIASPLAPPTSFAPNPAKARLALNLKRAPFETAFVELPDIAAVRAGLGCPAVRKFADGSDYDTLPVLRDPGCPETGAPAVVVGDSFDIAVFLERAFPPDEAAAAADEDAAAAAAAADDAGGAGAQAGGGRGRLFPPPPAAVRAYESPAGSEKAAALVAPLSPQQEGLPDGPRAYARFNTHVDATFTAYVQLAVEGMPLNPSTADAVRATFAKRAGVAAWDDLLVRGEARARLKAAFEAALAPLAALFAPPAGEEAGGAGAGPFVGGARRAAYADLIVGGWLQMLSVALPEGEWRELRAWHGGVFGRLHDALRRYL